MKISVSPALPPVIMVHHINLKEIYFLWKTLYFISGNLFKNMCILILMSHTFIYSICSGVVSELLFVKVAFKPMI